MSTHGPVTSTFDDRACVAAPSLGVAHADVRCGHEQHEEPVYLDDDLLARLEGLADEAGVDRDAYVQDALRRYLAGRDLVALQREVSSRSGVAFDDALDLVYSERDAARDASSEAAGQSR